MLSDYCDNIGSSNRLNFVSIRVDLVFRSRNAVSFEYFFLLIFLFSLKVSRQKCYTASKVDVL